MKIFPWHNYQPPKGLLLISCKTLLPRSFHDKAIIPWGEDDVEELYNDLSAQLPVPHSIVNATKVKI